MTLEQRPFRVLLLSWHAEDGAIGAGGHRRTVELVKRFERWGEVHVVDALPSMFAPAAGISIHPYAVPALSLVARVDRRLARIVQWPWALASMVWVGRRVMRRETIDVVYVPSSELLPCVVAGVVLSKASGRPLVLCNMNVEGIALAPLVVALHNVADRVVALSPGLAQALLRRGLKRRPHVIGCGTPVQVEPSGCGPPMKEWDAVFVGRHTQAKGILDLLDVWERVVQGRHGGRLALVGSCSEEMARLIDARCRDRRALRGAVVRLGVVSETKKNSVLASSRVLLFPSRAEGWGFVPQEALLRGLPVVCWDLPAYEASLPLHEAVVRVPLGDVPRFAEAAIRFLDCDDAQLRELAAAAPLRIPSWDDIAAEEWAVLAGPRR